LISIDFTAYSPRIRLAVSNTCFIRRSGTIHGITGHHQHWANRVVCAVDEAQDQRQHLHRDGPQRFTALADSRPEDLETMIRQQFRNTR